MRLYYVWVLVGVPGCTALGLTMGRLPQPPRPHLARSLRQRAFSTTTMAASASGPAASGDDQADVQRSVPSQAQPAATRKRKLLVGALLTSLVFQNAGQSLVASSVGKVTVYDGASVALVSELAKVPLILAGFLAFKGRSRETWGGLRGHLFNRSGLELSLPSICFAVQNVLFYTALRHVDAATYSILSQSKTLFTAVLFVTILKVTTYTIRSSRCQECSNAPHASWPGSGDW
jgi:hypothetical protein